jgi:toxin YoeB
MSAKHRTNAPAQSPAVPDDDRQAILLQDFRRDLTYWIESDPRLALRVMRLIEEVLRSPFSGLGKPEPLRHESQGQWSRRITEEHRMVYRIRSTGVFFMYARGHYGRR